jgi:ubiquinone/menaquinone biosynthesis C-methylase UbiE
METQLEQIREQQRQSWDAFSPGWKKWDHWVTSYLQPLGDEIIRHLKLKKTDIVLDVATGTGEPGLTIARIVKNGKVIGSDLSEGMLQIAKEKAEREGVGNFEVKACDVCELPFPDDTFDAISCRLGFMFFPDMHLAAKEMARVIKPGGRMATTVWGAPERNFWVTSVMAPITRIMEIPSPPPGSPGMFRCSDKELMADLFKQAGLKNILVKEINANGEAESFEQFWEYMNDLAAPVVAAMGKADDATKKKIKNEVSDSFRQKYPGEKLFTLEYQALLIYAEK